MNTEKKVTIEKYCLGKLEMSFITGGQSCMNTEHIVWTGEWYVIFKSLDANGDSYPDDCC
jgi:hypothetical protein